MAKRKQTLQRHHFRSTYDQVVYENEFADNIWENLQQIASNHGNEHHHLLATNVQDLSCQVKMRSLRLQSNYRKMHDIHVLIGLNLMRALEKSIVRLVNQKVEDLFLYTLDVSTLKFVHSKIMHVVKSTKG